MVRLIPRDVKFFHMFADMASNLGEGARLLKRTLDDFQDVETRIQQLSRYEAKDSDFDHRLEEKHKHQP